MFTDTEKASKNLKKQLAVLTLILDKIEYMLCRPNQKDLELTATYLSFLSRIIEKLNTTEIQLKYQAVKKSFFLAQDSISSPMPSLNR